MLQICEKLGRADGRRLRTGQEVGIFGIGEPDLSLQDALQCGAPRYVMFVGLQAPLYKVPSSYHKPNSYCVYVHQLGYRTGAPHCKYVR